MPIQSTNPIEHEGNTYPYFGLNLAVSPRWRSDSIGASLAVRLTPFRITAEGQIESLPSAARPVTFSDAFAAAEMDADLAAAINAVMAAVQAYVMAKGL